MKITFDTNCFYDYYLRDPSLIEELINLQKQGSIEIAMTTRVEVDTLGNSKIKDTSWIWQKIKDFPILEVIGTAFRIGMSKIGSDDYIISEEDNEMLERLRQIMIGAQVQDIDHLFGHIKAKRDIFVSNDKHFLNHQTKLKEEFSVVVLNPSEAVQKLKAIVSPG